METITDAISLKPVNLSDKKMLFEWRNTPFLIKLGSSGKAVTWKEHCRWFNNILEKKSTILFIIKMGATPVGQVRFDPWAECTYLVSIYLLEEYTGKGIGAVALQKGIELMTQEKTDRKFIAFIKMANRASQAVFSKTGFIEFKHFGNIPQGHIAMVYNREEAFLPCISKDKSNGKE